MQREQGREQIRVTTLEKPRKYIFFTKCKQKNELVVAIPDEWLDWFGDGKLSHDIFKNFFLVIEWPFTLKWQEIMNKWH